MIASLRGTVGSRTGSSVVIEVNGIGYLVEAALPTLQSLGDVGHDAYLLIHSHSRDGEITLFGFRDAEEKTLFLMLTGVQGVGPKVGLAILSIMSPDVLLGAISRGDRTAISAADRVGPKLAARICTELADKAGVMLAGLPCATAVRPSITQVEADVRNALVGMGYARTETENLVAGVVADGGPLDTASLLQRALRAAWVAKH